MTSYERSGWRDQEFSKRHRTWGTDCPMVDIDTLWVEYTRARPRAIVEYKHDAAGLKPVNDAVHGFDPGSKAVSKLATSGAIPAFVVRYSYIKVVPEGTRDWLFEVFALNDIARDLVGPTSVVLDEVTYVRLLYQVRGDVFPPRLEERLANLGGAA